MKRELIYVAVVGGCVGALTTMALGLVLPLGAQSQSDANFENITASEVTCENLEVSTGLGTVAIDPPGIRVFDENGLMRALLVVAGDTTSFWVYDNNRKIMAVMDSTEHGGRFIVHGKDGVSKAVMGVNEYGNGAVNTWD